MKKFFIYTDDESLDGLRVDGLENAVSECIKSDCELAIELIAVDEDEIKTLNANTRGMDKVTDVLSYPSLDGIKGKAIVGKDYPFETDENGRVLLGSIVICKQVAKAQAIEFGHSFERELHYLIVHGIMHCLGYDHITDDERAEMRVAEERVLTKLGITRE